MRTERLRRRQGMIAVVPYNAPLTPPGNVMELTKESDSQKLMRAEVRRPAPMIISEPHSPKRIEMPARYIEKTAYADRPR